MNTHEVLVTARNYLAQFGWIQNAAGAPGEPRCATGAILSGGGAENDFAPACAAATALVQAGALPPAKAPAMTPEWAAVIEFNDRVHTTKEEVLTLFDKAIAQTAPAPDTSFLTEVREEVTA